MNEAFVTRRMALPPDIDLLPLLGPNDDHLRTVESELDVQIVARGHDMLLKGTEEHVRKAERLLGQLADLVRAGTTLSGGEVRAALRMLADDAHADIKSFFAEAVAVPSRRKLIAPKSLNQRRYLEAVRAHDLVFAIGPAGTGKSYLGVAMAVAALTKRSVARIVLTRPAVEAGERLGFLPGDLYEKVHPYLRPLYDALYDMLEAEKVASLTEKGAIEIAPLAYMRGRTLNDSFIILDEAQNATSEQMKMFLTRLGFNSKMVVTGDITQVDLPSSRTSGLIEIQSVLAGVPGISFVYFNEKDVVRHHLVSAIIRAYDARSAGRAAAGGEASSPNVGRAAAAQFEPSGAGAPERARREARPESGEASSPNIGRAAAAQLGPSGAGAPERVRREARPESVEARPESSEASGTSRASAQWRGEPSDPTGAPEYVRHEAEPESPPVSNSNTAQAGGRLLDSARERAGHDAGGGSGQATTG